MIRGRHISDPLNTTTIISKSALSSWNLYITISSSYLSSLLSADAASKTVQNYTAYNYTDKRNYQPQTLQRILWIH